MKIIIVYFLLVLTISCASEQTKSISDGTWKEESAKLAQDYATSIGTLYPEYVSDIGFSEFDSSVTPFSKDLEERRYVLAYQWRKRLERMLQLEVHPEMRTETSILLENSKLEMEGIELSREEGIVPFLSLSEFVFSGVKQLLENEATMEKKRSALARFHAYVHGQGASLPLVDGYLAYLLNRIEYLKEKGKKGFWPFRKEVVSYLENSTEYIKAIEDLFKDLPEEQWRENLQSFTLQDERYREFLKKTILPKTRQSYRTPLSIYRFTLKEYGIFKEPKDLINDARVDYGRTYEEFIKLGNELATEFGLPINDPVRVVKFLELKSLESDDELLEFYNGSVVKLLEIIQSEDLLSLEKKPNFIIRFGSSAEMQSIPAPHFISPSLLDDKQKQGQYIIPRSFGAQRSRDFSFPEAIVNLTAHEGIPGHGLQYQSMKERGTTLIRTKFAFNSANVEGWALYAEEMVYPYLSKTEQFITLQRRLWRQARMYLDPLLNQGEIDEARIYDVYVKELGFSKAFAESELKRYSYIMPGQAPAYYYGLVTLLDLKNKLRTRLGASFAEKCFNDALLDLGVLPLTEVSLRLLNNLKCDSL